MDQNIDTFVMITVFEQIYKSVYVKVLLGDKNKGKVEIYAWKLGVKHDKECFQFHFISSFEVPGRRFWF